ncbi:translation initiation factor IF-2 [Fructilactobacillus cliffordii]|uniref:translation initiation factor IF-2 n=1 Tax=Fructilactobacillus cliffordii TaxID=2940299 RepID=UPI002092F6CD|nr:translation initiation factor IF-2 [Fructilactobacillus cliffordii]USS86567.1 translation initiation factor IF-2 [Fructilactobacillus cliffordii]
MAKKRIYELAKELNVPSKKVLGVAQANGIKVKNHMSSLDASQEKTVRGAMTNKSQPSTKNQSQATGTKPRTNNNGKANQQHNGSQVQQGNQRRSNANHSKPTTKNNQHQSDQKQPARAKTTTNAKSTTTAKPKTGGGKFGGSLNRNNNNNKNKKKRRNNRNNRFANMYSKNQRIRQNHKKKAPTVRKNRPLPEVLVYEDGMNAQDLGKILHREPAEIIKKLFMLGMMVNQNQSLDKDAIELLAADYGVKAQEKEHVNVSDIDKFFEEEENNTSYQAPRPPVVTIMGHVDHGKTTLLDYLRHSHITSGEAGGITQAIGAYQLKQDDHLITFLDTPGHAAFTEMRARGANITDITVLVVAADDGVMPQTVEAIDHAKEANTPIIVAVNKIDRPNANPQHVKEQLMNYGLVPEDYGGDTIFVDISAKNGTNVDELLNMIILQADVMELKANPKQNGAGSVVEARLDRGKGPVATLLVQQGTLRRGDPIVVGDTFGRVRTMTNEAGQDLESATPSTPVEITGLNAVPEAGDRFVVFDDEKTARVAGEERAKEAQIEERKQNNRVTLDNLFDSMKQEDMKQVNVIIKADVQGSVEALADSLKKIDVEGVNVNVIHASVGAVNESDIALAKASNAIIIGFNVRPTPQAKVQAETDKIDVRLYQVIYNAIDDVTAAMKGKLDPTYVEEVTGSIDVRQIYKASAVGTIAGGMVNDGYVRNDSKVRLVRDGVVKYDGELGSLKRFKDDVKEVKQGHECGLTIENYNDIKVGDVIEAYHMKEVAPK